MGRGCQLEPPIPASFIAESFTVRQDGALIRAASARGDLIGEPATYRDPDGALRVRVTFQGRRRTINAAKAAWILATAEYPAGQIIPIGTEGDFRFENLTVVPNCRHRPMAKGGRASSLEHRRATEMRLLSAMAEQPGAGLMQLARITGTGEGRVCAKLGRLAKRGLAESPRCCPGRSWAPTDQGRAVVLAGRLLIDDIDRAILSLIAKGPLRQLELSRRAQVCSFTAKRRFGLLVERGLATVDIARRYSATDAGREALGPEAQPQPRWVNVAAISAAAAKDVRERAYVDDRTQIERSRPGRMAKAAARANKSLPFNRFPERERLAG